MKVHKRPKNSRIRGARTVGWGFRQKHKGHGNKGGFGMAGTGKRGDHKKQSAEMSVKKGKYFGKQGITSRGTERDTRLRINLYDIEQNMVGKTGKVDLAKYKILGSGNGFKGEIVALEASKLAIEKMEKAGGKIILPVRKEEVKQWVKVEKKVVEKDKKEE